MEFEWDQAKARMNFLRHGVSFEDAARAFEDAFALEWLDVREAYGEERSVAVAMVRNAILYVVFTERGGKTRIISARKANGNERNDYYRQNAR